MLLALDRRIRLRLYESPEREREGLGVELLTPPSLSSKHAQADVQTQRTPELDQVSTLMVKKVKL